MDYIEAYCQVEPVDPWRDILIAELADIGFESFSEEIDGFKAYIPACDYRPDAFISIHDKYVKGGPRNLSFELTRIGGKNWNAVWESNFDPVLIGNACYIRAPFHDPPGDVLHDVVIEPKMSFGTGHHETTSLIVEWLLETDLNDLSVLDMGSGTGVLAIIAHKMGAGKVTAIDNYVYAYENTKENALGNGINNMRVLHGDATLLGDELFDVIIANITRNVLLEDMAVYEKVLHKGGIMLLSGFLYFDKDAIFVKANRLGLELAGEKMQKDWVSLKFNKPIK